MMIVLLQKRKNCLRVDVKSVNSYFTSNRPLRYPCEQILSPEFNPEVHQWLPLDMIWFISWNKIKKWFNVKTMYEAAFNKFENSIKLKDNLGERYQAICFLFKSTQYNSNLSFILKLKYKYT